MSGPAINCSPEIIADLERKIVALQSKLEQAELSEANLSVWKRSAEISIESQTTTISRLAADNEALRKENERLRWALDDMLFEYGDKYDSECRLKDASELDMIAKARAALREKNDG